MPARRSAWRRSCCRGARSAPARSTCSPGATTPRPSRTTSSAASRTATGIKVNFSTYGSNDEAENKLRAAGGAGFDVIFPSVTNGPRYYPRRSAAAARREQAQGRRDHPRDLPRHGQARRHPPRPALRRCRGTGAPKGITFDSAALPLDDGEVSFGSLWQPGLDGAGRLPAEVGADGRRPLPRRDRRDQVEPHARHLQDRRRTRVGCGRPAPTSSSSTRQNIGAFWNNATEATAAFTDAGCTIGQTWDTTGILLASRSTRSTSTGRPRKASSPGSTASPCRPAPRTSSRPTSSSTSSCRRRTAARSRTTTGYNSCVAGAEDHLDEDNKTHLQGGLHRRR